MNSREKGLDCKCCVTMDSAKGSCTIKNPDDPKAPPKMFTFDGAYFTDSTTEAIYNDIAYPLVEVGKNTGSVKASACMNRGVGGGYFHSSIGMMEGEKDFLNLTVSGDKRSVTIVVGLGLYSVSL